MVPGHTASSGGAGEIGPVCGAWNTRDRFMEVKGRGRCRVYAEMLNALLLQLDPPLISRVSIRRNVPSSEESQCFLFSFLSLSTRRHH